MASVNRPSHRPEPPRPEDRPPVSPSPARLDELNRLLKIQVPVIAVLAEKTLKLREVLDLAVGSLIQLDKPVDEPLDLKVNNHPIATGHTVRQGENFALRITHLNPVGDTIRKLGRTSGSGQSSSQE